MSGSHPLVYALTESSSEWLFKSNYSVGQGKHEQIWQSAAQSVLSAAM